MAECLKRFLEEHKAERKDKLLLCLCIPNTGVENSIMGGGGGGGGEGHTHIFMFCTNNYISNRLF